MSDHQRVERATKNAKFSYSDRLALRRRSGGWWKRYTNRILRALGRRDQTDEIEMCEARGPCTEPWND